MPPKKNSDEPKKSVEELITLLTERVDARFDEMAGIFKEMKEENGKLKERVSHLEEENTTLKTKLHNIEMHSRSSNIRIFNFTPENDDYSFEELASQIYDSVLLPILQGAVKKGRLRSVPSKDRLIVSAHPLPAREGKPRPVFCRLFNGYYRTLILQCQKEFGLRAHQPPGLDRRAPLRCPIYEDSTAELFKFKQKLAAHSAVSSAWISGGVIRYKLENSDTVRKVKSIFDSFESILSL